MTQNLTRTAAATLAHNEKPVPISPTFKRHMAALQSGRNPRQAAIIADIATIQLVGIDWIDNRHCTFIYRATGRNGDTLTYINTPWQSGGNGPESV